MNALAHQPIAIFDVVFCLRLLQTFGHFLWQAAAVAALVLIAEPLLRMCSAAARYRWLLMALLIMAACPMVTWLSISTSSRVTIDPLPKNVAMKQPAAGTSRSAKLPPMKQRVSALVFSAAPSVIVESSDSGVLERCARWIVAVYLCIVAAMVGRLMLALRGGRRLRGISVFATEPEIIGYVSRIGREIGLRFVPAVGYCRRITVPAVVGVIRPMVLLPVSIASDLSAEQLQAILAHELAHIWRFDHLVNLIQRLIEAFLFFHPAIWYVSGRIRTEREFCCDDLVLRLGTTPTEYADGLLRIAAAAKSPLSMVAVAAIGRRSRLHQRISAMLSASAGKTEPLPRGPMAVAIAAVACALMLLPHLQLFVRGAEADSRILSLQQLSDRMRALRSTINDLCVFTSTVVVKGAGKNDFIHQDMTVILKGSKAYLDEVLGRSDGQTFERVCAYDGHRTATYFSGRNTASIQNGRNEELNTKGIEFFDLNLLNPPLAGPAYPSQESLLAILASPGAAVRDNVEMIDTHPCEVVDVGQGKERVVTVWLDLDEGLLPMKQAWYMGGKVGMEFKVEKAIELPGGFWVATRGHKILTPDKDNPYIGPVGIDTVIIVSPMGSPGTGIAINQGIDNSVFDLLHHIPAGTLIVDQDSKAIYRAGLNAIPAAPTTQQAREGAALVTPPVAPEPQPEIKWNPLPWGDVVEGLSCCINFRQPDPLNGAYIDLRYQGPGWLDLRIADCELEVDGIWYKQKVRDDDHSWTFITSGGIFQALGPWSLQVIGWSAEKDGRPLKVAPGKHLVRIKIVAHHTDENGPIVACISTAGEMTIPQ